MVADVIGKEYTRPVTAPVSVPNAWKGRDVERDGGSGGRKYSVEEAEQFLCSMLGDNSELGMGVVRDVLGETFFHLAVYSCLFRMLHFDPSMPCCHFHDSTEFWTLNL
jgi:hypothetical protein